MKLKRPPKHLSLTKKPNTALAPENIEAAELIRDFWYKTLDDISQLREIYLEDPEAFSRVKKISFEEAMAFPALVEKGSTSKNIKLLTGSSSTFSAQAMFYRLDQISPQAFEDWFKNSRDTIFAGVKYEGKWHIYAIDGTENRYYHDKNEPDREARTRGKANSSLRAVVLYDVTHDLIKDAELTPSNKSGEPACAIKMIERNNLPDNAIVIDDRAYEGVQTQAAYQENGTKYITRMKDQTSDKSLMSTKNMPDGAYDEVLALYVSKSQKKQDKLVCELTGFKFVHQSKDFKYFEEGKSYYLMAIRVIRFWNPPVMKGEKGEWITLSTNLSYAEMSTEEIIALYTKRWPVETGFLKLKEFCHLEYFHSRKTKLVMQEFWAKLVIYNFMSLFSRIVGLLEKEKYYHHMNWSHSYDSVMTYLTYQIKVNTFLKEIYMYTSAIREGRHTKRKPSKSKGPRNFRG